MFHTVYRIENLINGMFYYGVHSTNNLDDGYYGSGKIIKQAVKKYGKDNFSKTIVEVFDTRAEALNLENILVDPNHPLSYNMAIGGGGGGFYNKQHTDEFKSAISLVHKGKIVSDETRAKMKSVVKPKGHKRSDEIKSKISKTSSGKGHPSFINSPIKGINAEGEGEEKTFASRYDAAMFLGLKLSSNISKAIKTGGTAYGYKWYEIEQNKGE